MSPTAGQTTTGQPLASARTSVPWPPWQTTDVARGHRLRVGQPRDEHRVGRDVDRRVGLAAVPGGDHAHGLAREPLERGAQQPVLAVLRGRGRHEHDRARRRAAGRPARPAAPTSAARPPAPTPATRAGTRAAAAWRPASARARGPCAPTARGGSPSRRRDSLNWSRPCSQRGLDEARVRRAPTAARRAACAAAARRSSRSGSPGAMCGYTCGTSVATGTPATSAASDAAGVMMSATATSGRDLRHHLAGLARGLDRRGVGLEVLGRRGGEDLVLRRVGEVDPRRLGVRAPALPRLEVDLVPARDERRPEREHRERVARVAERAEEDLQDASSATWRSCAMRSSNVHAIGATIRVPTPASR